ncbi:hypothetical protein GCM10022226_47070 [Sphaerisporangium flaviroseum]|uniref:Uncharacterized protein n=1 Tax=Sphaerisporangium flaviroseum TaxID=509199 RepID=A0ABP7ILE4_9ACTN
MPDPSPGERRRSEWGPSNGSKQKEMADEPKKRRRGRGDTVDLVRMVSMLFNAFIGARCTRLIRYIEDLRTPQPVWQGLPGEAATREAKESPTALMHGRRTVDGLPGGVLSN